MTPTRDFREVNRQLGIPHHRVEPQDIMFVAIVAAVVLILIANLVWR